MKTVRDRQTYVLTISVKVQTTPFNRECRYDEIRRSAELAKLTDALFIDC